MESPKRKMRKVEDEDKEEDENETEEEYEDMDEAEDDDDDDEEEEEEEVVDSMALWFTNDEEEDEDGGRDGFSDECETEDEDDDDEEEVVDREKKKPKWSSLEHKGPVFAPPYERLPETVKFWYNGEEMRLSEEAEEVACLYAKMLDDEHTTKEVFNKNFFKDWRNVMTDEEKGKITELKKCNFKDMHRHMNRKRTEEEKLALKEKNDELLKEYGFCEIDGQKEKIENFKIEPPGLFIGRGEHPKMGMLKKRVEAEDIIINCGKDSKIPKPPPGHEWKEVRHDQWVIWLASWIGNVQKKTKYIKLDPSSKLKGETDKQKYETARELHKNIEKIRKDYRDDWESKEMRIRQRAVALYFIDKLALRAGNKRDEDQADTVGCCSLRVEHIELHEQKDDKEHVVVFDFLGKDSVRYYNEVPVEERVFKNLQQFKENKAPGKKLFDRLNTSIMNKHLNDLMEGLTAKVFRTYNASWTLQQQLDLLTNEDDSVAEKIRSYNMANMKVAKLCNHQRSVRVRREIMENLQKNIDEKCKQISEGERKVKEAQRDAKLDSDKKEKEKEKETLEQLKHQLAELEIEKRNSNENKTESTKTSKLNYNDPRITVAWCKKYGVPIEEIYNQSQMKRFKWAIDEAGPDYRF